MSGMMLRYIAGCSLGLLVLGGCGSAKKSATAVVAPQPAATTTSAVDDGYRTGIITTAFASAGCPLLIQLQPAGEVEYLIPIALDDRYKKDGMRLKFTSRPSKASSGNCGKGQPAILENITVM